MVGDEFTSQKDIMKHKENKKYIFFTLQDNPGTEHNINSQNSDS